LQASVDKWTTILDMGYVIASRYNVILVCLSLQQNVTIFPLRSKPPIDVSQHQIICIGHVYGNHFVQVSFISYQIAQHFTVMLTNLIFIYRLNWFMVVLYQM